MIAYTGIETVSNLAEEARDPSRSIPSSIRLVAVAVFAIYFTLPLIALSALPVYQDTAGHYVTKLGLPPEKGGFENDPVLGLVEHLGLHGTVLSVSKIYVGILAATILFIATNAGVIGASRITYSMATYRQLPEVFRRLHPRFKTPWLALLVFAGGHPDRRPPPRQGRLPRDDVLVRRDALVHDRARIGDRAAAQARPQRRRVPRPPEPADPRVRLAALRRRRRPRDRDRLARGRPPVPARALVGPRAGSRSASSSTGSTAGASSTCRCGRRCARPALVSGLR